jgi:hypothetical protein
MRANVALITCVFLGGIGAAQGGASVTPGESSKCSGNDGFCGATVGYLPSKKLTVAVAIAYGPMAFRNEGNYENVSDKIFTSLGNALAPDTLSKLGQ